MQKAIVENYDDTAEGEPHQSEPFSSGQFYGPRERIAQPTSSEGDSSKDILADPDLD